VVYEPFDRFSDELLEFTIPSKDLDRLPRSNGFGSMGRGGVIKEAELVISASFLFEGDEVMHLSILLFESFARVLGVDSRLFWKSVDISGLSL